MPVRGDHQRRRGPRQRTPDNESVPLGSHVAQLVESGENLDVKHHRILPVRAEARWLGHRSADRWRLGPAPSIAGRAVAGPGRGAARRGSPGRRNYYLEEWTPGTIRERLPANRTGDRSICASFFPRSNRTRPVVGRSPPSCATWRSYGGARDTVSRSSPRPTSTLRTKRVTTSQSTYQPHWLPVFPWRSASGSSGGARIVTRCPWLPHTSAMLRTLVAIAPPPGEYGSIGGRTMHRWSDRPFGSPANARESSLESIPPDSSCAFRESPFERLLFPVQRRHVRQSKERGQVATCRQTDDRGHRVSARTGRIRSCLTSRFSPLSTS